MKRLFAVIMSVAVFGALAPTVDAQSACPEVEQAKEMFSKVAKAQDVQAPRTLAGARQDQQAPRSQDVQAPRSLAGARSQDVQAPRGQDVQAPRGGQGAGQNVQAPHGSDAGKLIREAEAACKAGKTTEAKAKAEAAINMLK